MCGHFLPILVFLDKLWPSFFLYCLLPATIDPLLGCVAWILSPSLTPFSSIVSPTTGSCYFSIATTRWSGCTSFSETDIWLVSLIWSPSTCNPSIVVPSFIDSLTSIGLAVTGNILMLSQRWFRYLPMVYLEHGILLKVIGFLENIIPKKSSVQEMVKKGRTISC